MQNMTNVVGAKYLSHSPASRHGTINAGRPKTKVSVTAGADCNLRISTVGA